MNIRSPAITRMSTPSRLRQLDFNKKYILTQRAYIVGEIKRMNTSLEELHAINVESDEHVEEISQLEDGLLNAARDLEETSRLWDQIESEIDELMGDLWAP